MTSARNAIVFLLSLAICGALGAAAQGVDFQTVQPAGYTPAGLPFSEGILAGNTLYVSGQGPQNPDCSLPATFEGQVRQTLRNVRAVLQSAGMDYDNIAWMNVYVTSAGDIAPMNKTYWETIGPHPPARTVVVVSALAGQGRVEINCVAVKRSAGRRAIWPRGWRHGKDVDPPGVEAGDVLYMSAMNGANPKTGVIPSNFSDEVRQALDSVSAVTEAAAISMKNVLWVNPYMSGNVEGGAMNRVYKTSSSSGTRRDGARFR